MLVKIMRALILQESGPAHDGPAAFPSLVGHAAVNTLLYPFYSLIPVSKVRTSQGLLLVKQDKGHLLCHQDLLFLFIV